MAYELSMWTAYPVAVVEDEAHSVPALVLVAPNLSDVVDEGLQVRDASTLAGVLGRAVRHAASTLPVEEWDEDDPMVMSDVLTLAAEDGVFRSALYDKGVVLAVPGERIDGCRIGLPATIPASVLDFWPR